MPSLEQPVAISPQPAAVRPSVWRRLVTKIREHSRFSLATLVEWMAAYAFAFAAAWCRAEQLFISGILVGVLLSGLCARVFLRSEGRRVLHYLVFALVIAGGAVLGALVLREMRTRAAERLIAQDAIAIMRLKEELDAGELLAQKRMAEAEKSFIDDTVGTLFHIATLGTARTKLEDVREWVDAEWHSRTSNAQPFASGPQYDCALALVAYQHARWVDQQRLLPTTPPSLPSGNWNDNSAQTIRHEIDRIASRSLQMKAEAASLDVRIAPIPRIPDDWTPLLVPVERRSRLRVTCEMIDYDVADVKRAVLELTGLHVEFAPGIDASQVGPMTLRVSDMQADLWLTWIGNMWNLEPKLEPGSDTVVFDLRR